MPDKPAAITGVVPLPNDSRRGSASSSTASSSNSGFHTTGAPASGNVLGKHNKAFHPSSGSSGVGSTASASLDSGERPEVLNITDHSSVPGSSLVGRSRQPPSPSKYVPGDSNLSNKTRSGSTGSRTRPTIRDAGRNSGDSSATASLLKNQKIPERFQVGIDHIENFEQLSANSSLTLGSGMVDNKKTDPACDGVVCCLGCLSLFPGVKKKIVDKVAFFPPSPPGYYVMERKDGRAEMFLSTGEWGDEEDEVQGNGGEKDRIPLSGNEAGPRTRSNRVMKFPSLEPLPDLKSVGIETKLVRIGTSASNIICGIHLKRTNARKTIVFSHGNSTDIGLMFSHFRDLAAKCRVNVFGYDYSGYGHSTGSPSERNLYSDVQAVYFYLTEDLGIAPNDIVLYGQSIGSCAATDLASQLGGELGGVVLHSAFKSGLSVVRPETVTPPWYDVFLNEKKLKDVEAPVFLIHGTSDEEIRFEHALALYEACKHPFPPWWVHGGGHNDIEVVWRSVFFSKVRSFLEFLEKEG